MAENPPIRHGRSWLEAETPGAPPLAVTPRGIRPPDREWSGPGRRGAAGEVEARLAAGAGEGDVAPLLERALVAEEDEGSLDGRALGGVAGERVAVLEMLAAVRRWEPVDSAAVRSDDQGRGRRVELDN